MRPRKKKHAKERISACSQWLVEGAGNAGRWGEVFGREAPLHVEIGCGKGGFAAESALCLPGVNFLAVEKVPDVAVIALERAKEKGLENLRILIADAADLKDIFAFGEVSLIYLNFSDPWPKLRHAKRRLTSPGFLEVYKDILSKNGQLHMKTDNRPFFEYSLKTFEEAGFKLQNVTFDLHANGPAPYPMTEYESKFSSQGIPICRLEAIRP